MSASWSQKITTFRAGEVVWSFTYVHRCMDSIGSYPYPPQAYLVGRRFSGGCNAKQGRGACRCPEFLDSMAHHAATGYGTLQDGRQELPRAAQPNQWSELGLGRRSCHGWAVASECSDSHWTPQATHKMIHTQTHTHTHTHTRTHAHMRAHTDTHKETTEQGY